MIKVIIAGYLIFAFFFTSAQSWNPFVNQGIISPSPLLPAELNGKGVVSFNVGNTGSSPIPLVKDQEMTLVVTFSNGVPDNDNPVDAISGTYAKYFDWTFDESVNTFFARQNQQMPGNAFGSVIIQYKVTNNTTEAQVLNGFNVNLQPPPFTNGVNLDDDQVSSYTYVKAVDYGDAPLSYGMVYHEINFSRDPFFGYYLHYMFLGSSVDNETTYQSSSDANGDDLNGVDDEDGTVFPLMTAGNTYEIEVEVKIVDGDLSLEPGRLNAWIDWNGDGDFLDSNERIANNIFVDYFTLNENISGTVNLTFTVPSDVNVSSSFARIRFGSAVNSPVQNSSNIWGEVEDYQVFFCEPPNPPDITVTNNCDGSWLLTALNYTGKLLWSTGDTTENIIVYAAGDYNVTQTINSCTSLPGHATVSPSETPDIYTSDIPEVCAGESFDLTSMQITDKNSTDATYTYHSASPADSTNLLESTIVSPDKTTTYYVLASTSSGCTDELAVELIINDCVPVASDDSSLGNTAGSAVYVNILINDFLGNGDVANPEKVTIDIDLVTPGFQSILIVPGEGTWTYNTDTGQLSFAPENGFISNPAAIVYTLVEMVTGLTDNAVVNIGYIIVPPATEDNISTDNIPGEAVTVDILDNSQLSDGSQALPELVIIDIDPDKVDVQTEKIVPGEGIWVYNPATGEVTFTPETGFITDPTPIEYVMTEISTGLSDTATVSVSYLTADCELFIPEIFSPNDDGIQDYFRIYCFENYPDAKIEIYNRWGNLVYVQEHYGNEDVWGTTEAWWGGYSNHNWKLGKEKLPPATYFYILFLNDGSKPRNGYIFLNR